MKKTAKQLENEIKKLNDELAEIRKIEATRMCNIPKKEITPIARRLKKLMKTGIKVPVDINVYWSDSEVDYEACPESVTRTLEYKEAAKILKAEEKAIEEMIGVLGEKYNLDSDGSINLWERVYDFV